MATLTLTIGTTLGAHGQVARIVLHGKGMGLEVEHDQAGGWFSKTHLLRATGSDTAVRQFYSYLLEQMASLR